MKLYFSANVEVVNITLNSATIQWIVSEIDEPQQYRVYYSTVPGIFENSIGPVFSADNPDLMFQLSLENLTQGTTYYIQVVSTFGIYNIPSDVISFTTLEPGTRL